MISVSLAEMLILFLIMKSVSENRVPLQLDRQLGFLLISNVSVLFSKGPK